MTKILKNLLSLSTKTAKHNPNSARSMTCHSCHGSVYPKIIAWYLSGKADADLAILTFQKAYQERNAPYGLMFHSDRGSQYTAFSFRQLLDSLKCRAIIFQKRGIRLTMRKEETNRRTYHTLQELHASIFEYIEGFYNSEGHTVPLDC